VKRFIVLTFLLLGWGYYELSGGAEFAPEQRPEALAEVTPEATTPDDGSLPGLDGIEIVTRADTTTVEVPAVATEVALIVPTEDIAAALETVAPETEVSAPVADLRAVTGDRVNMREGPGRDFGVIDQLDDQTRVSVIDTAAEGWVQVEVISTGQIGWMSQDFLVAVSG
jgi:hypothetical protein